jgi:rRNA maturation endonuclease Nob1
MKKKIPLRKSSLFIKCIDCQHICLNDDDNVCLKCGSKFTKRILVGSKVLEYSYGEHPYETVKKSDLN